MWLALILFPYLGPFITFCNFILCFYGMERLFKAWLFLRVKWRQRNGTHKVIHLNGLNEENLVGDQEWPKVTIQLPMYNERNVVERLILSVAKTDYPLNKLQIQVLDDSTDETSDIVKHVLGTLPRNYPIEHIQRKIRTGYKAGALADGLKTAIGEFIVVFDADFVPEPDFVKKIVAPFFSDPKIGVVQGRWGYLNEDESLLTKLQSIAITNHFAYEQFTRYNAGLFLNFNGTCGAWRRSCIDDAGGWEPDTLAEDLDMSYRAQFRDWKIVYIQDIICPGELPNTMDALKVQQYRWAKGGIQCFKKHVARIIKSDRSLFVKIMCLIHLSGYTIYIPMFLLAFLPAFIMPFQAKMIHPIFYVAGALGPSLVIAMSQISLGQYKNLKFIPLLLCLGYGLMLNNFYAVIDGMLFRHGSFKRTPKSGQGAGVVKAYEVKKIPLQEIVFLAVSSYVILYGDNVNPFFYLSHLFYSICYVMMLYFSYYGHEEEEVITDKSHQQSKGINFNDVTKFLGQLGLISYVLFLAAMTLTRFPAVTSYLPVFNGNSNIDYDHPAEVDGMSLNPLYYSNCGNFAKITEDNYLVLDCYRRPAYKASNSPHFLKYQYPVKIDGEYVLATCFDKYQLIVRNNKNETKIERALEIDASQSLPNLLTLMVNQNYGDFHVEFESTMKIIEHLPTSTKSTSFVLDNLRINELDKETNDISLVSGCGIVDDSDKKASPFFNKQKDSNSLVEYSHDSTSSMYCTKPSTNSETKFNVNDDVFLWNRFQKNGYVTLYGDEKCTKRAPGQASSFFNKRGGESVDHSFGNYTCGKHLSNRDACVRKFAYEPSFNYITQFWNNYENVSKMSIMKLNVEAQNEYELENADKKLSEFIQQFAKNNTNSILTVVLGADTSKPKLAFILSNSILKKYPTIEKTLESNQDRLVTLFDLHSTFASIPYYPANAPHVPSWSYNLLTQTISESRNCNDARISSTLC